MEFIVSTLTKSPGSYVAEFPSQTVWERGFNCTHMLRSTEICYKFLIHNQIHFVVEGQTPKPWLQVSLYAKTNNYVFPNCYSLKGRDRLSDGKDSIITLQCRFYSALQLFSETSPVSPLLHCAD